MPGWSDKDERKYEHIKEGYEERGGRSGMDREELVREIRKKE
ncbi:MAG: hypothetical protein ACYC4J_11910 [Gemmatimonadaceae bacterium]